MPKTSLDKRNRLVQTAVKLSYHHGFNSTSLADIAQAADVPLGNVYYYFKTKEELGEAVVAERLARLKLAFKKYDHAGSAQDRLCEFVDKALEIKEALACHGCPVGTLSSELQKDGGTLAEKAAVMFDEMLEWAEVQFSQLGEADPSGAALHLIAALQGASVMASTLKRSDIIVCETERLKNWIREY